MGAAIVGRRPPWKKRFGKKDLKKKIWKKTFGKKCPKNFNLQNAPMVY